MKIEDFLQRLSKVKRNERGWTAICPAHPDNSPSLAISNVDGKILVKCFTGCSVENICAGLNLELKDLFNETNGVSSNNYPTNKNGQVRKQTAVYDYTDVDGTVQYQTVRYEPKDFRQRRPDGQGGWIWNLQDVRLVLYRLPEVIAAPLVYLVEGERDVETLRENDLVATCNPMGAGKWRDEYNESLRDKTVVILPDNDDAGQKHAVKIATSLYGIAKEIVVVNLPNLSEKGDVTDYFRKGGTADELIDLVARAKDWKPSENNFENSKAITVEKGIEMPELSDKALYGLAGDVIRTIEPHTEADNVALLVQLLAGFGCLIGMTAHFRAEADYHYMKLFAVMVGASSKGRKGTSWGQIKRLFCRVDETFSECLQDGLSSGEGLIFHVRDAQTKQVPIKVKGRITDYQEEIVDEGATEKRAFVVEPEFARVLRAMQREGNTLSSVIRQAWDSDRLRVMTKNPIKASGAQISIIGHITKDELARNLDETDTANGFANRFLWIFTRRSKYLPEGGNLLESALNSLVEKLNRAVIYARQIGELSRDEQARQKWIEIYPKLSDGHTGLLGSVTSRAEAQVMRLASIYSLLDCAEEIRLEHLEAALALWQYCEDSAAYIFGNQTGNKNADVIYAALLSADKGLSRTNIRDLFHRNLKENQINTALTLLLELGRVEVFKEKTDGRDREIFTARLHDKNDINDKSIDIPP